MGIFDGMSGLERGVAAAWTRNSVILNNVANVDTPNFKASHVEFEDLYKAALEEETGEKTIGPSKTQVVGPGKNEEDTGVSAIIVQDDTITYRMDNNNVDIDKEMTDFTKNVIYYNMLTNKVSGQFNQLRMAIKEQ